MKLIITLFVCIFFLSACGGNNEDKFDNNKNTGINTENQTEELGVGSDGYTGSVFLEENTTISEEDSVNITSKDATGEFEVNVGGKPE